jgi:hypothetical protein
MIDHGLLTDKITTVRRRKINERSKEPVTTYVINVNTSFDSRTVIRMTKASNDPHLHGATTNEIQKRFHHILDHVLEVGISDSTDQLYVIYTVIFRSILSQRSARIKYD